MSEPDLPKPIPTLQTALFVGSWLTSWWSLLKNSILMFGAPKDVVIVAPAVILLLGLIRTNVQGYLDEKAREEFTLAKAAAVHGDMIFLLHRDGKTICSGKPTKVWKRLQVRQALGRGIPLSMVYTTTWPVVASLKRQSVNCLLLWVGLSYKKTQQRRRHANSRKLSQIKSGFAALTFPSALDWAVSPAKNWISQVYLHRCMNHGTRCRWPRLSELNWSLPKKPYGKVGIAAHPLGSCNRILPIRGPAKAFNELLYRLLLKGAEESKELKRSTKRLVRKWDRLGAFGLGLFWKQVLRIATPTSLTSSHYHINTAVLIMSIRNWQMDFLLGFIFLVASMLPLAKAVQERRHLKSFINKVPIWIHFAIDILLVECAVVGTLMSLFIHEGGGRITGLRDFMLHEVSRLLDNLSDLELEIDSIDDLLENLYKYNGGF